jgi:hypothetical protein
MTFFERLCRLIGLVFLIRYIVQMLSSLFNSIMFPPRKLISNTITTKNQQILPLPLAAQTIEELPSTTLFHLHNLSVFGSFNIELFKNRWFFNSEGLHNYNNNTLKNQKLTKLIIMIQIILNKKQNCILN